MKIAKLMLKKLKKGMTLVELVVAISLASIIFAGAGTALFAINRVSKRETKDHVSLSDAKNLATVIDLLVKEEGRREINLPLASDWDEIGKENCDLLFTIGDVDYGFEKTTFGVRTDGSIENKNRRYESEYPMYITILKHRNGLFTEFVIHYGDNYASSLSLVERI